MKRTILFAVAILLFATACSKKSNQAPQGSMSANIDGVSWKADYGGAGLWGGVMGGYHFDIVAYKGKPQTAGSSAIEWQLLAAPKSGQTFQLGVDTQYVLAYYNANDTILDGITGKLTFSNVTDSVIQGSFEFTAEDSVHIRDGSFSLPITPNMF